MFIFLFFTYSHLQEIYTESPGQQESPVDQCRQLKQIAAAIYEALHQTPLLFISQKEEKKPLKHKDFAFCGKRPRALPFGNL